MKTQSILHRLLDYIFSPTPLYTANEIVTIPNTLYPGCWRPRMISADDICSYTTLLTELHKKGVLRKYSDTLIAAKRRRDRIKKVDRILRCIGLGLKYAKSPVLPLPAPPLPLTPLFTDREI